MKKVVSFKIDQKVNEMFQITTSVIKVSYSEVVEGFMVEYIEKNKQVVKESIKNYFDDEENMLPL